MSCCGLGQRIIQLHCIRIVVVAIIMCLLLVCVVFDRKCCEDVCRLQEYAAGYTSCEKLRLCTCVLVCLGLMYTFLCVLSCI